jgi:hypothetical protein
MVCDGEKGQGRVQKYLTRNHNATRAGMHPVEDNTKDRAEETRGLTYAYSLQ